MKTLELLEVKQKLKGKDEQTRKGGGESVMVMVVVVFVCLFARESLAGQVPPTTSLSTVSLRTPSSCC